MEEEFGNLVLEVTLLNKVLLQSLYYIESEFGRDCAQIYISEQIEKRMRLLNELL